MMSESEFRALVDETEDYGPGVPTLDDWAEAIRQLHLPVPASSRQLVPPARQLRPDIIDAEWVRVQEWPRTRRWRLRDYAMVAAAWVALVTVTARLLEWQAPGTPTNPHVAAAGPVSCNFTVSATPSQATFESYANGTIVCFNNGSYTIGYSNSTTRTGYVTYQSVSGQGATFDIDLTNTRWLDLNQFTGAASGDIDTCSQHIKLRNFTWTPNVAGLHINGSCGSPTDQDLTIDGGIFDRVEQYGAEGRLSLNNVSGITIKNSQFTGNPSTCSLYSDGIYMSPNSHTITTTIGPRNLFADIVQSGSCGPHVDNFQLFNGSGGGLGEYPTEIFRNYFRDGTVFLGYYDGENGGQNIHDNVFQNGGVSAGGSNCQPIQVGGSKNFHFHHNTLHGWSCSTGIGTKAGLPISEGFVWENNIHDGSSTNFVFSGDQPGCGSDCIVRYNLKSNGATLDEDDGNNTTGTAIYTGSPLSFANWAFWLLDGASPGKGTGNDGQDRGTLYYGS